MEGISVEYFPNLVYPGSNETRSEFHSYISDENEKDAFGSHFHIIHLFKTNLLPLFSIMSEVWKYNDSCSKQCRCALDIYLMTVLSYLYGIIMDRSMNAPVHRNNVVGGINANYKLHVKSEMETLGKLESNGTSNIGMIPSVSKDVSIKFAKQCLHILTNNDRLNGIKGSTKM